ncbi:hypothetical protein WKV44_06785 [Spirochaetia bacterium 38H-sp]|uniref:Outer membrane protein beta-barrel domain-containing protein n=1 Tax=Rarispira pelagica TaxID=3141764 RepID=A0ABU9UC47_9SPIR
MEKNIIITAIILLISSAGWTQSFGFFAESSILPEIMAKTDIEDIPVKTPGITQTGFYFLDRGKYTEGGLYFASTRGMSETLRGQTTPEGWELGILTGIKIIDIFNWLKAGIDLKIGAGTIQIYSDYGFIRELITGTFEATGEITIQATDWFYISGFAGYQIIGNYSPGKPFADFLSYSPVLGIRLALGER